MGSSPLTRGKRARHDADGLPRGLIPAHAGKTRSQRDRATACPGSSPLTRGKPRVTVTIDAGQGLIPAHAGKTLWSAGRSLIQGAHPRSRGENDRRPDPPPRNPGSSPLTRGKRGWSAVGVSLPWLIPAHAGKTLRVSPRRSCSRAHPRSRGENGVAASRGPSYLGSSPLTRGKLGPRRRPPPARGLIPAHAGKTGALHLPS